MENSFKRFLSMVLVVLMVFGTLPTNAFAMGNRVVYFEGEVDGGEETSYVAKVGETEYATFAEAMNAANAMTGDVIVDVYDEVEFVNGMELNGSYTSITFNGQAEGAKITINQSAGGDYLEAHGKTVAFNNLILAKANPAYANNSGHMGNYFSIQGGTVTYTSCTFPNGACTSSGTATYEACTFQNASEYGLWVYDDAMVTVNGGTIDSKKGIKVYSEGEDSVTSTLTVKDATFTEKVTAKPAVAVGYAESITLIGNTYNNTTGVLELDSGSDADCNGVTFVAQDSEGNDISSTITAVDRSNSNAPCGVLVGDKIYTTATEAAKDAKAGDTVTLLYNTTEKVEFAEGVTVDKNNYTADNVTVKETVVTEVATFDELVAAIANGGSIKLTANITTTAAITTSGVKATIDLNGKTLTIGAGDNKFNAASNITIENGTISITGVTVGGNAIFELGENETTQKTVLTLNNVNLVGDGYSSAYGVFYIRPASELNVNGGEWNLKNDTHASGGVFKADASTATLNISDAKMTFHNVRRGVTYAATTIEDSTIAISGDADGVDAEMEHGFNRSPLTIKNSTVTMKDMVGRGITAEKGAVVIENSTVSITNAQEATIDVRGGQTVTIDENSTVTLDKEAIITSGTISGTVSVVEPFVEVDTYEELIAALAVKNAKVRMTADITATATQSSGYGKAGIVVDAGDVLDGNQHKLTINGANTTWDCAIAMRGGEVRNLTIAGAMRGIFMPGANGDVVIDNCVFEDVIYTFNSDAGSKDYTVTIKDTVLNGWTSFSAVHKSVTFEKCVFGEGNGYAYCRPYQATTFAGCEFAESYAIDATQTNDIAFEDCKYNGEALTTANGSALFSEGGTVTINGEAVTYGAHVAYVGDKSYATLQEALNAAAAGDEIVLLKDVELEVPLTVAADKTVTLDLNGKTITYNSTTQGEAMITNKGTLTINDSSDPDTGVINYNYTGAADSSYGIGNYTISNSGTLTVNGGKITIANLRAHAKYPIDNNSTSGDAILVINGGHLYNYNTSAIRQFCNSTTNKNSVTINGGLIEGYCAIWMQNPGKNTVNGSLSITGGEIKTTAAAYVNGTSELKDVWSSIYCTIDGDGGAWDTDSAVSITGGIIKENVNLAEEAPAAITIGEDATFHGYVEVPHVFDGVTITCLEDLKAFRDAVNAGDNYSGKTVTLTADIDLAGEEWTPIGTSSAPFNGTFDGGNHTISNLVINGGSKSDQGFFGRTNNGEIKNLTINNAKVSGRLNVGALAGTPYTSKYTNIKLTGHVEINGFAYVGGLGGKNAYANWTDITIDVDESSYVKATSTENGIAYRTYVGGVIGFNGEGGHTFKNITSNINVIGDVCDVGGLFGIAHYGNNFENVTCTATVTNTNTVAVEAAETGGIAGVWHNAKGETVTFKNISFTGKVVAEGVAENAAIGAAYYADNETADTSGSLIIDGKEAWLKEYVAQVGDKKYTSLQEALEAAKGNENIVVDLVADATLDIKPWQTLAIGGDTTETITINGNGKTLTFNQLDSDWNHVATNNNAKLILNNMKITNSGYNDGPWNRYDINFGCDVELNNVTSTKALAFKAGATLNTVTINETGDNYAIWIQPNGQTVAINGLTVNSEGRGIKIDEQYVEAKAVKLSVANATFTTAKKAAIMVKTAAGADITLENVDISGVKADTVNAVWNDSDAGADYGKVNVTGGTLAQEDAAEFAAVVKADGAIVGYYKALQEAINAAQSGYTVTLLADVALTETIEVTGTVTLDLNGKTISMNDVSGTTAALLKNNGTLTIKDKAGNGKITFNSTIPSTNNGYASNTISNYGTLTIDGGVIENTSVGGACYALDNYAGSTATINGGKLTAENTAVRIFNWTDGEAAKAKLNINGGEIVAEVGYGINFNMGNTPAVELNISGGTITTNDTVYNLAVYFYSQGSAENVKVTVTGGTFNGNFALNGVTSTTMAKDAVAITGGTFDGVICYGEPKYGFISGGTFTDRPDDAYVAEGYQVVTNTEDGTYVVVKAEEVTGTITLNQATLELESIVYLNIYSNVEGFEGIDLTENMGLLVWTGDESAYEEAAFVVGNENTTTYNGAKANNGLYSVQTAGIDAKKLGDEQYMRVYVKVAEDTYVYSRVTNYGPQKYALDRLKNSTDENLKKTLVAMLDYAAAAQIEFGYRTDDLANNIDEAYLNAYRTEYSETILEAAKSADEAVIGTLVRDRENCPSIIPTLILEGIVTNNYRFKFTDEIMKDVATAKVMFWTEEKYNELLSTGEVFTAGNASMIKDMTLGSDGYYAGGYDRTAVKDIENTLYVCAVVTTNSGETYYSGVVAHSAHAYIADRLANSSDAELKVLLKALAVYGDAAKIYFANR